MKMHMLVIQFSFSQVLLVCMQEVLFAS